MPGVAPGDDDGPRRGFGNEPRPDLASGDASEAHPAAPIADILLELGATHVLGIPDNGSMALFELLRRGHDLKLLTVTREGEAFGVASGLWIGGKRPVVVLQCTGLLESGDALRGTAQRMGVPLLLLVGYRGHDGMVAAGLDPFAPHPVTVRQRAEVDSAALATEPTLRAWGVPYSFLEPGDEVGCLRRGWEHAHAESCPVAVLVTGH